MVRPVITEADAANLSLLGSPELLELLTRATVVACHEVPADVVTMNSQFRYSDTTSGEHLQVVIVYPEYAAPELGRISVLSPAGMALLGVSAGERIQCVFPDGIRHDLRLEAVLHQPEYDLRTQLILRV